MPLRPYFFHYNSSPLFTKEEEDIWGCIYWTRYKDLNLNEDLIIKVSDDGSAWQGSFSDPSSASIGSLNLGNTFYYQVNFPDRNPPLKESIVFDDIHVTFIKKPQFFMKKSTVGL